MVIDNNRLLALLIDGNNALPKIVGGLLAEIASYGITGVSLREQDVTVYGFGSRKPTRLSIADDKFVYFDVSKAAAEQKEAECVAALRAAMPMSPASVRIRRKSHRISTPQSLRSRQVSDIVEVERIGDNPKIPVVRPEAETITHTVK